MQRKQAQNGFWIPRMGKIIDSSPFLLTASPESSSAADSKTNRDTMTWLTGNTKSKWKGLSKYMASLNSSWSLNNLDRICEDHRLAVFYIGTKFSYN